MEKVLIGYGGVARELIAEIGEPIKCFVDTKYCKNGLFDIKDIDSKKHKVIIAIGDPSYRIEIVNKLPNDIKYWNYISKYAIITDTLVNFGYGNIICAGSIITTNVSIGNHVYINTNSKIAHDCEISDFVTISPGTNISGNVKINSNVYIGSNSAIKEKTSICSNVVLGLNTGVVRDITEEGVYVGTPCVKIK